MGWVNNIHVLMETKPYAALTKKKDATIAYTASFGFSNADLEA